MEDRSKERILKCAKDLFHRYGIRSISMDDIAHHLGISKKTIYQHFTDKDQIVTLAMEDVVDEQKAMVLRMQEQEADVIGVVLAIHRYLQARFNETTAALLFDLQKYHARAWKTLSDFKSNFLLNFLEEILLKGVEEGYFRPEINTQVIARVRLEELSMIANEDVFPKTQFNQRDVSGGLLEHFIHGICTEKGRQLYEKHKEEIESNALSQTNDTNN